MKKALSAVLIFTLLMLSACSEKKSVEPPAIEKENFVKAISGLQGTVEITPELREQFNLFARENYVVYLPDIEGYESYFLSS